MTKHKHPELTPAIVKRTSRIDWPSIVDTLRAHPGQWFKYEGKPTAANPSNIREGSPQAFLPAGSFDAFIRGGHLYLCFVGEPIVPWVPRHYLIPGAAPDPRTFDELDRHPHPAPEHVDPITPTD